MRTFPPAHRAARGRAARGGAVLAITLVALLIVSMIGASLLRDTINAHRASRRAEDRLQAMWLAESALDRARWRLSSDDQYVGETWNVGAEAIGGRHAASAMIEVSAAADSPDQRRIRVVARFPEDLPRRTLQTVETEIPLSRNGASP